jgi:hypothetical protein
MASVDAGRTTAAMTMLVPVEEMKVHDKVYVTIPKEGIMQSAGISSSIDALNPHTVTLHTVTGSSMYTVNLGYGHNERTFKKIQTKTNSHLSHTNPAKNQTVHHIALPGDTTSTLELVPTADQLSAHKAATAKDAGPRGAHKCLKRWGSEISALAQSDIRTGVKNIGSTADLFVTPTGADGPSPLHKIIEKMSDRSNLSNKDFADGSMLGRTPTSINGQSGYKISSDEHAALRDLYTKFTADKSPYKDDIVAQVTKINTGSAMPHGPMPLTVTFGRHPISRTTGYHMPEADTTSVNSSHIDALTTGKPMPVTKEPDTQIVPELLTDYVGEPIEADFAEEDEW